MYPAIEKLMKYLDLEERRGFDNRAVLGGLQRMLEPWKAEAQDQGIPETIIEVVVSRLQNYPNLSNTSRKEVLQGLRYRLVDTYPELQKGPHPAPGFQPQPSSDVETEISTSPEVVAETETPSPSTTEHRPQPGSTEATARPTEAAKSALASKPSRAAETLSLNAPITAISGIGSKSAGTLRKLDLQTVRDVLWHFPRRYDDYTKLKTIDRLWFGEEVTIIGTVDKVDIRDLHKRQMKLVEASISDGTGILQVTWFNQPWIANRLTAGKAVVLSGKVDQYLGRLTMNNPEWELVSQQQLHTNRIVPVYPLTAGVSSKWLRRVMSRAVEHWAPKVLDPLPEEIRQSADLIPRSAALQQIHFPDSWESLKASQERFAFDEMFLLQFGVLQQKYAWTQDTTEPFSVNEVWIENYRSNLPYQLTEAQNRTLSDLRTDLAVPQPMNRLLQGDVGCGKTVIATACIGIAATNGIQSAVMAPTSILAEQHCRSLYEILPKITDLSLDSIRLLVGATPNNEKEIIRQGLSNGSIRVVIGTHALLEDPVDFARLGLVVIDEQHRFGVEQRAMLRSKGANPNLLVMTATPIPRSLALTIYGDLDLSIIDEMPPGRIPVETRILRPIERSRAYHFLEAELEKGRQAFIIYPLVEDSEKVEAKAAVEEHKRLQREVFKRYKLGLLHGRLRPEEKETVMADFRAEKYDILISTSVVEVGVDIPNASVMLIEGANRFGLAQLHQFRGRVGRSTHKSYCLLIPDTDDELENERLKAMETTNDGFRLAELDLQQRGPGDFLGTRQSGFTELRMAKLTDMRLIEKARREARKLFETDPELSAAKHQMLSQELAEFWPGGKGEQS